MKIKKQRRVRGLGRRTILILHAVYREPITFFLQQQLWPCSYKLFNNFMRKILEGIQTEEGLFLNSWRSDDVPQNETSSLFMTVSGGNIQVPVFPR